MDPGAGQDDLEKRKLLSLKGFESRITLTIAWFLHQMNYPGCPIIAETSLLLRGIFKRRQQFRRECGVQSHGKRLVMDCQGFEVVY